MPYLTYRTYYPNEVHQLIVSVSKHMHVLKNGQMRYQNKPMEAVLANCMDSPKDHVVHYLIRDHFSGAMYAEVSRSSSLMALQEFLHRAWAPKEDYEFCGMPEAITIPNTVLTAFPRTERLMDRLGIEVIKATSGFQAGVRDLKTWEDYLCFTFLRRADEASFEFIRAEAPKLSAKISRGYDEGSSKILKWKTPVKEVVLPPDKQAFFELYRP